MSTELLQQINNLNQTLDSYQQKRQLIVDEMTKIDTEITQTKKQLIEFKTQYPLALNREAEIKAQQKQIQDQIQANTAVVEKHQYTKRCWIYLQNHEKKKIKREDNNYSLRLEPIFTETWEIQHSEYSWDQIIKMAHQSHFNGLLKHKLKTEGLVDEFLPIKDLLQINGKEHVFRDENYYCGSYCNCLHRPYDYPDKHWKEHDNELSIKLSTLKDIMQWPNQFNFSIDTYPKIFNLI